MSTILIAMAFVMLFSAAAPQAWAGAAGGILHIPSSNSLAHCISRCGDVDISYPFGIGSGCFRQGFDLTCDHSTKHPKLFLGSSTMQVTASPGVYAEEGVLIAPIIFHLPTRPGKNTYSMSWEAPAAGITVSSDNTLFVAGCDFDATLLEYGTEDIIGSCVSRCGGKKAQTGGPCNGIGCCLIPLPRDLPGFRAKLVSINTSATKSDWLHPGIMAAVTVDDYLMTNTTDLFSSWTNANKIDAGTFLSVSITDQPSCESAQMHNASYACSNGSSCQNSSSGTGYQCSCPRYAHNPYILDGCMQDYYNPKPKEHCPTSCGRITVPFPFGIEEGCFANERFRLNCTSGNLTVFISEYAQYHVTDISVEDGTLIISNMVDGSHAEEAMFVQINNGNGYVQGDTVEDQFDFSLEYDIVMKWAVSNLTCQTAVQKHTMYACRSSHSDCLNVTHGEISMGYRCKCSQGFQGNPYIKDGCTDIDECALSHYCNGMCQNIPGSYKCTSCPHRKEFDPIKRHCVMSAKQHNLFLGIAIGTGCGLGCIIIAVCAIVFANKWKKGIQKRIPTSTLQEKSRPTPGAADIR